MSEEVGMNEQNEDEVNVNEEVFIQWCNGSYLCFYWTSIIFTYDQMLLRSVENSCFLLFIYLI